MEITNIARNLHKLERRVVPYLAKVRNFSELVEAAGMKDVEVMRAVQWLSNKGIIKIAEEEREMIELGKNGKLYRDNGLPERRFLNSVKDSPLTISEIMKKTGLDGNEINICLGALKKKVAIDIRKDKEIVISITEQGRKLLLKETLEEQFLKKIFPLDMKSLEPEERFAFDALKNRKEIIFVNRMKIKNIELTEQGKELIALIVSKPEKFGKYEVADKLTSSMVKSGTWRDMPFREYDVSINVPNIYGGKRHFVEQAVDYIKKIWLELGFKEMTGNIIQTSFWDLDSLFVPQDHPARQMQDTFYVKEPKEGKLPANWRKIKEVHENGADTGSRGWGERWSIEIAKENLLRTHTTVLSAQTIADLKESDMPAKFFSVGRVFRNEAVDWKHLFELTQVEGIVVDPDANFKHLIGYLREFFLKMGYPDVRVRPGHFPYTEPSAEVDVYDPNRKCWIELGGSGIFRPEVTKPLIGKEVPVLAWGLGMERIISEYWGIKDIRELYKNDLKQMREMRFWMR